MQGLKLSSCAVLFKMLSSSSEVLQKTGSFNQHGMFRGFRNSDEHWKNTKDYPL